jgi:arylsulfatase
VREGKWKLVAARSGDWELYNLEADRTELNDLAHREPARVTAMSEAFQRWHQVEQ